MKPQIDTFADSCQERCNIYQNDRVNNLDLEGGNVNENMQADDGNSHDIIDINIDDDCTLISAEDNSRNSNNRSWFCRNIEKIFADKSRERTSNDDRICSNKVELIECNGNSNNNAVNHNSASDKLIDDDSHIRPVIIIGNGPSAMTLSYILSGHWPYYSHRHPSDAIHNRLSSIYLPETDKQTSLIECDLSKLSSGLLGRTLNPVSLLFDQLQNPNSDSADGETIPSCLEWRYNRKFAIDHLVLGQGLPGGLWYHLRKSKTIFSVSRRLLMQLPGLDIVSSFTSSDLNSGLNRISYRQIYDYYQRYIEKFDLASNFRNHTQVTRVEWNAERKCWVIDAVCKVPVKSNCFRPSEERRKNVCYFSTGKNCYFTLRNCYNVSAVSPSQNVTFKTCRVRYYARKVVLATGASASSSPSHLNIDGEEHKFVIHSLSHFETILQTQNGLMLEKRLNSIDVQKPKVLIVVGSGLSSADALSMVSETDYKVLHVFRRSVTDRTMIFNQLSNQNLYPEYTTIHRRMKQSVKSALCFDCFMTTPTLNYQAYQKCVLDSVEITPTTGTRLASLHFLEQPAKHCSNCQGPILLSKIVCDYVLVLIGSKPKLDFLQLPPELKRSLGRIPESPIDIRHNPIKIASSSYESTAVKNLYAMGPLVGDSFVRFVQGGALAIAADLWQHNRK